MCTVSKVQRLGKPSFPGTKTTASAVAGVLGSNVQPKPRPLLVTFRTEAELAAQLQNAKNLQHTSYDSVFVRKWLTKDEREAEKNLREKCN